MDKWKSKLDSKIEPTWQAEDGSVTLYCGDCLDILPTLEAGSVDAVVTDPPYGIGHPCNYASRGRGAMVQCNEWNDITGDTTPFDPAWILGMCLPSVLWGGNHYSDKLPTSGGWLVWDKQRPSNLDQSTCELAWTNCIKGVRRFSHLWNGMMRASEHGENYHPTQKPVALFGWILSLRWIPQGTIFDPYMGSGPCGIACIRTGHKYIGIEIDRHYFDIAVKRIEAELKRSRLFLDQPKRHKREKPKGFGFGL